MKPTTMDGTNQFRYPVALSLVVCALYPLAGWTATVPVTTPTLPPLDEIVSRLARSEQAKRTKVQEFTGLRRYVLRNSHAGHDAAMTVRVSYRKGEGKTFEVLNFEGAPGIGKRVLERVIEGEAEGSRSKRYGENSVTPEHYSFTLLGMGSDRGRRCYILELHPRGKSKYLLQGKAWVDAEDFALVKIEGRPTANLSFFAGKPMIVQEFQKYGQFWMASFNHSESDSLLLGKTELTIEYKDYEVHGVEPSTVALQR